MNVVTGLFNGLFSAPLNTLAEARGNFWLPPQSSTVAKDVDWIFYYTLIVCAIFFVGIILVTAACVAHYRYRPGGQKADVTFTHSTLLEMIWTIIPAGLLVPMFWYGYTGYMEIHQPPRDCYDIIVTGKQWSWDFTYPNGVVSTNVLHAPVGVPIRLTLESADVLHSLFIPAFRIKRDAVPGRYNIAWFKAVQEGTFQIYCAEYCGKDHSNMLADCIIESKESFDEWMVKASDIDKMLPNNSPVERGEYLFKNKGCTACHSLDRKPNTGPNLLDIWGTNEPLESGESVQVDDNYVRESIVDPMAKIRKGFQPLMPTFKGKLTDKELTYLVQYVKSLTK